MKKPIDLPDPPTGWHYYQPDYEGATQPRGFLRQWNANLHATLVIDEADPLRCVWRWQVRDGIDLAEGRAAALEDACEAAEQLVENIRAKLRKAR